MVGHTPLQMIMGALLGIGVGIGLGFAFGVLPV
jgi:membrane-associated phospholipid phosphatase